MKMYSYRAINLNGDVIKGKYIFKYKREVIESLRKSGFYILNNKPCYLSSVKSALCKCSYKNIATFSKELGEILKCGIDLNKGLEILSHENNNKWINIVIITAINDIEKGLTLSDSLSKFPNVFPKFFISMLSIGEQSGNMEKILFDLYKYYWNEHNIASKIKSALIYPCTVFIITIAVGFLTIFKIIPNVIENLLVNNIEINEDIEKIIKINKAFSNKKYIAFIVSLMIIICIIGMRFRKTISFTKIKLSVPKVKDFYKEIFEIKFSKSLSILIGSGVSIIKSLLIIKDNASNEYYENKLSNLILNIKEGMGFSKALKETKLFNEFFISMMNVGEETGSIEKMLDNVAFTYEKKLKEIIEKYCKLIEPFTIIVLALFVTWIIIKFMFPILDAMNSISNII